ncbi:MAG: hypothetical protein WBO10_02845 [Pyrinomonadaceae bacterium]
MNTFITSKERNILYGGLVIGVAGAIAGLLYSERFWAAFLQNSFYFIAVALGGAVFVAINHVANSGWTTVVRRVPEAIMGYVPIGAISMLLLFFGRSAIYEWTGRTYSHGGHELVFKNTYLSEGFFFTRMIVFLATWITLIFLMRRESLKQDLDGNVTHTNKNKTYSAIFLVVFGITFTFAVFDWIMSIEPMFYSTIYAFYHIAGVLLGGSATVTILVILLRRRGFLKEVGDRQMHALGILVFGFTTFWAYIWVCQYLLIYYANIPEETIHYVTRTSTDGWSNVFFLSLFLNWVIPFLMLIRRSVKSNENWMLAACGIILVGRWVDLYVLIFPTFFKTPMIGFVDIALPIGFAALFLLMFVKNLNIERLIPSKDPYLEESMWQER